MNSDPNLDIAQKMQERFEFYLIALTFTILGLSIQTATFGAHLTSDILELTSWLLLFISGIVGLSRLEWLPVAYKVHAEIEDIKKEVNDMVQAQEAGQDIVLVKDADVDSMQIQEVINSHNEAITKLQPQLHSTEKWTHKKYLIHKWSFVLGVLFLLLARGYSPASKIICQLTNT